MELAAEEADDPYEDPAELATEEAYELNEDAAELAADIAEEAHQDDAVVLELVEPLDTFGEVGAVKAPIAFDGEAGAVVIGPSVVTT